jgi:hypothetical protein
MTRIVSVDKDRDLLSLAILGAVVIEMDDDGASLISQRKCNSDVRRAESADAVRSKANHGAVDPNATMHEMISTSLDKDSGNHEASQECDTHREPERTPPAIVAKFYPSVAIIEG